MSLKKLLKISENKYFLNPRFHGFRKDLNAKMKTIKEPRGQTSVNQGVIPPNPIPG
jgi:hypothetical protein